MKYLVTGAAGFIGYHTSLKLLKSGGIVIGVDNLNDYYDVGLKKARLNILTGFDNFSFKELDISNSSLINDLFLKENFECVIHLAAQAGVRYSIDNPRAYVDSNLIGHFNILEGCRHSKVAHLVYASSSSVYGLNKKLPFSTYDNVDHPASFYAATKKANELMSHSYAHLYATPVTGLRFFTVYGPWGRPDMALFKFTNAIFNDEPIEIYNNGMMSRDFTYIDDVVESIVRVSNLIPNKNESWSLEQKSTSASSAPYKIYNIGNSSPIKLLDYIVALERCIGKKAIKNFLPMQSGDVVNTYSDNTDLYADINFSPKVNVDEGISLFVSWYKQYYGLL